MTEPSDLEKVTKVAGIGISNCGPMKARGRTRRSVPSQGGPRSQSAARTRTSAAGGVSRQTDGMTVDSFAFSHAFLSNVAPRIVNDIRGINRVVYDVTSKPPGTIE